MLTENQMFYFRLVMILNLHLLNLLLVMIEIGDFTKMIEYGLQELLVWIRKLKLMRTSEVLITISIVIVGVKLQKNFM